MPIDDSPRGKTLRGAGWPCFLLSCSLAIPLVQAIAGVPLTGYHQAHDGKFALWTLIQFQSDMAAGVLPPRWSARGFGGLGSPIFYFYPPGAFVVTWLFGALLPDISAAALVSLGQFAFRIGSTATCFLWLRGRTDPRSAALGSALYGLMPYTAVINPQVRLAFAECAAAAIVPLFFAAIDAARGDIKKTLVLLGPATALLAVVHLPSTVLAGGLGAIYASLGSPRLLAAIRRGAVAAGGVVFGLGIAAYFVVPAVTLLKEITPAALTDIRHSPETNFLLASNGFRTEHGSLHGLLLDLSLVIPLAACLATARAALSADPKTRAMLGTCLIGACLTLSVSGIVWTHVSPLRMVQFPWRLLLFLSLLASASVAIALPVLHANARRMVLFAAAVLAVSDVAVSIKLGDGFTSAASRTQQAIEEGGGDAPEYLPANVARHGWFDPTHPGKDNQKRAADFTSQCVQRSDREFSGAGDLKFDVHECSGRVVLPQFYFPGWAAVAGTTALSVFPDPVSGLASVVLGPASETVLLSRKMLGDEKLGAAVSVACVMLWAVLFRLVMRPPHGMRRGARTPQHPVSASVRGR